MPTLKVGDVLTLREGHGYEWTVQATNDFFTVLTTPDTTGRSEYAYTVIDWEQGIRGPCNLIGQGWNIHTDTIREDCESLLAAFCYDPTNDPEYANPGWFPPLSVEISHRNNVDLVILTINGENV